MVPTTLIELMKKDKLFGFQDGDEEPNILSDELYVKTWFWVSMSTEFHEMAFKIYDEYMDLENIDINRCESAYNYYTHMLKPNMDSENSRYYHSIIILDYITRKSYTLHPQPHIINLYLNFSLFVKIYFQQFFYPIIDANPEVYSDTISFHKCYRSWVANVLDCGIVARTIDKMNDNSNFGITTYQNNSYKLTDLQNQTIVNFISRRTMRNGQLDEIDSSMLIAYINGEINFLP